MKLDLDFQMFLTVTGLRNLNKQDVANKWSQVHEWRTNYCFNNNTYMFV